MMFTISLYRYSILIIAWSCLFRVIHLKTCGIDNSYLTEVYEGSAKIETYPWLGYFIYASGNKLMTTGVVLVTKQAVLASAVEIDKLPKWDIRARSHVVLGHNCTGPPIKIREYSHHPDFASSDTLSTLTLIQLDIASAYHTELRPICAPPTHLTDPIFYAMVLPNRCQKSKVMIHKMKYVSNEECKDYYRRTDLDIDSMWPAHTACASGLTGGKCIWRSGAILTIKYGNRWRLLGFGVYGPGCQAPARFLDYTQYHNWVKTSIERIGTPAITQLDSNHIVMRRMTGHIQRFGNCDYEEVVNPIYQDEISLNKNTPSAPFTTAFAVYNISLYSRLDYSCIIFRGNYTPARDLHGKPWIRLRRWCASEPHGLCLHKGTLSIEFYIVLKFTHTFNFTVHVYGKNVSFIDPYRVNKFMHRYETSTVPSFDIVKKNLTVTQYNIPKWFNKGG